MTLSGYLISIAGVSISTIMIEAILPEGNMAAFIRRIAALVVVFVIIAPIPSLIKKNNFSFGLGQTGSSSSYLDNNLLSIIYRQRGEELESTISAALKNEGINCEVFAPVDLSATEFSISFVTVSVVSGNSDIESIKRVVKKYVKIDDSKIFVT